MKIKLADFGCAKRFDEALLKDSYGSIYYVAPEVL